MRHRILNFKLKSLFYAFIMYYENKRNRSFVLKKKCMDIMFFIHAHIFVIYLFIPPPHIFTCVNVYLWCDPLENLCMCYVQSLCSGNKVWMNVFHRLNIYESFHISHVYVIKTYKSFSCKSSTIDGIPAPAYVCLWKQR